MTIEIEPFTDDEQAELRRVYFAGAYEILENLQDALLAYEADPGEEPLKTIKRSVHTLKGDSFSMGLQTVGNLCHRLEDVLSHLAAGGDAAPGLRETLDILLSGVDALRVLVKKNESGENAVDDEALISRIDSYLGKQGWNAAPAALVRTEYEKLEAGVVAGEGLRVYRVEVRFHPECGEKGIAARMVLQRLCSKGRVLLTVPPIESSAIDNAEGMAVIVATERDSETLRREAAIAGITVEVVVKEHRSDGCAAQPPQTTPEQIMPAGAPQTVPHAENSAVPSAVPAAASAEYLRIEASRVDRVMNLIGELIIGRSMIEQIVRELAAGVAADEIAERLRAANSYLDRSVSDLQKGVMKMRMVPVQQVFRKFPRMVRDLAVEKKKPVRLEITGKSTELDKGVVDSLAEPLTHIIRNMIDHGIEGSEERESLGKTPEGLITLRAFHEGSQVVIEIADDGRGINTGKLRKRAVEQGFLNQDEAQSLTDAEAMNLIFLPGLSTADAITDTSGRGVGMDAVKASVEAMRGVIEVRSTPSAGTTMRLRLPLTLAVIRALLFEAGEKLYALPVTTVAEVAKVRTSELATVHGERTLVIRDQVISLISLQELFQGGAESEGKKFALIAGVGEKEIGLLVDRLLGQQELVIKAVDIPRESGLIAGASILGNGKVAMVLDIRALVKKAVDSGRRRLATV